MAVLALALGIGANSAIFSVVNGVLLRPLPYADPDRLVVALHDGIYPVSPADFLDWQAQSHSFAQIGAAQIHGYTLTGRGAADALTGLQMTSNVFTLLGVQPILGRTFGEGDDQPGRSQCVVLSHQLWMRRFGGDPQIVGQSVTLNGESFNVLGVMPASFQFAPFWATDAELWAPLVFGNRLHDRGGRSLRVFARLKPGVSIAQAQSEMNIIWDRLAQQYPATNTNLNVRVISLAEKVVGGIRPLLLVLLGTVGFVLLIACANVANLILVRATGRRRETAVRLAIGSSRWRLVRQSVIESLVLASLGGIMGMLLARWAIQLLTKALPLASLPRQQEVTMDYSVFAFTLALSFATGLFCGIVPALGISGANLYEALKSGGRGSTEGRKQQRTRAVLVVCEVALALILLIGAGLMLRSFDRLQNVQPGFDARHVLTMTVAASGRRYPGGAQRIEFFDRLVPKLAAVPGVQSAALINHLPINGDLWTLGFRIAGQPQPAPGHEPSAAYRVVTPGYFTTMKIPLLQGRDFNDRDVRGAPGAAIISEITARHYWAGQNAIGQRIALGGAGANPSWVTIVGISGNVKQSEWTARPGDEMYFPYAQSPADDFAYMTVVLRTKADPLTVAGAAQSAIYSLDQNVPVSHLMTMEQVISGKLWRGRFSMLLLSVFAGIAILLASMGIYGVISYSVSQRTSEIGIRMALGAGVGSVLRLALEQGIGMLGAGIAIGVFGAWALTGTLTSLLYGVGPNDTLTFVCVPALLAAVGLTACAIPARRATRVDPMVALRYE